MRVRSMCLGPVELAGLLGEGRQVGPEGGVVLPVHHVRQLVQLLPTHNARHFVQLRRGKAAGQGRGAGGAKR